MGIELWTIQLLNKLKIAVIVQSRIDSNFVSMFFSPPRIQTYLTASIFSPLLTSSTNSCILTLNSRLLWTENMAWKTSFYWKMALHFLVFNNIHVYKCTCHVHVDVRIQVKIWNLTGYKMCISMYSTMYISSSFVNKLHKKMKEKNCSQYIEQLSLFGWALIQPCYCMF